MRTTQERLAGLFDVLNHAASITAELAAYLNELIEAARALHENHRGASRRDRRAA